MRRDKYALLVVLCLALLALCGCEKSETAKYKEAQKLLNEKQYDEAISIFTELEGYEESRKYSMYAGALKLAEMNEYELAVNSFSSLGEFLDSKLMATYYTARHEESMESYETALSYYKEIATFRDALERINSIPDKILTRDFNNIAEGFRNDESYLLFNSKEVKRIMSLEYSSSSTKMLDDFYLLAQEFSTPYKYDKAFVIFKMLADYGYRDSAEQAVNCTIEQAKIEIAGERYSSAIYILERIKAHPIAAELITECNYQMACELVENGKYNEAYLAYKDIGEYKDSVEKVNWFENEYATANELVASGRYDDAIHVYLNLGDYLDSKDKIVETYYLKADMLFREGKQEEATAALNKAKALSPQIYETLGFMEMKVAIAVDVNGKITSFEVVEHNETPGFGADIIDKGFDSLIGQDIATAKFDTVSGATFTCLGINDALKEAAIVASGESIDSIIGTNTYSVTGFGPMKVAIGVDEMGKITSFEVVEHNETPGFGADVIAEGFGALIGQDIATAQIDIKASVTMTSNGINEALKLAASSVPNAEAALAANATVPVYDTLGFQRMKVAIAVDVNGKITSFEVVEHNEIPGFGADIIDKGFDSLIGQDITTAKFDTVSGATFTCLGIIDALKQAASEYLN